jgi:hypothetical protein
MKVLDLQCQHGHAFEGWFGSEDDFQSQLARGLVECPLCGDAQIVKKLSAPRLNFGVSRDVMPTQSATDSIAAHAHIDSLAAPTDHSTLQDPQMQAAWLKMARKIIAQTDDVGDKFAQEARKIHYGEAAERSIRGQASREETLELLDEGIAVLPLPMPKVLKEPLQ